MNVSVILVTVIWIWKDYLGSKVPSNIVCILLMRCTDITFIGLKRSMIQKNFQQGRYNRLFVYNQPLIVLFSISQRPQEPMLPNLINALMVKFIKLLHARQTAFVTSTESNYTNWILTSLTTHWAATMTIHRRLMDKNYRHNMSDISIFVNNVRELRACIASVYCSARLWTCCEIAAFLFTYFFK